MDRGPRPHPCPTGGILLHCLGETAPSAEGAWEALGSLSARLGCVLLVPTLEKRSLMLQGGEALCWFISSCSPSLHTIARARADKNRVFVTLAAPPEAPTAIFDPLGQPLAIGVPGQEQGLLVFLFRPLARHKEMAPGSHVVFSRSPTVFGRIGASGGQRG